MTYDPYARESSGDNEMTQDQVYLRHIRQELQAVTAALLPLALLADALVELQGLNARLDTLNANVNSIDSTHKWLAEVTERRL